MADLGEPIILGDDTVLNERVLEGDIDPPLGDCGTIKVVGFAGSVVVGSALAGDGVVWTGSAAGWAAGSVFTGV